MGFFTVVVESSVGMVVLSTIFLAALILFGGFFNAYGEVRGTFFVEVFVLGLALAGEGEFL